MNNNNAPGQTGRPDYRLKNLKRDNTQGKANVNAVSAGKPDYRLKNVKKQPVEQVSLDTEAKKPKPVQAEKHTEALSGKPDYRLKNLNKATAPVQEPVKDEAKEKAVEPVHEERLPMVNEDPEPIAEETPVIETEPEAEPVAEPAVEEALEAEEVIEEPVEDTADDSDGFTIPEEFLPKFEAEPEIEDEISEPEIDVEEPVFEEPEFDEPEEPEEMLGRAVKFEPETEPTVTAGAAADVQPVFLGRAGAQKSNVVVKEKRRVSLHDMAEEMNTVSNARVEAPVTDDNDEDDDWTSKFEPKHAVAEDDIEPEPRPVRKPAPRPRKKARRNMDNYEVDNNEDAVAEDRKKPFSSGRNTKKKGEKKKNTALIVIIIILLLLLVSAGIGGYFMMQKLMKQQTPQDTKLNNMVVDTEANSEYEKVAPLENRNVFFAGIDNSACGEDTVVYLENPTENEDFVMKYEIYLANEDGSKGELIKETDLIPSGQHVNWKPAESLDAGEHNVIFSEQPFMPQGDDFIPLTAGENTVTLTIIK